MLDTSLPSAQFTGRDDMYALIRETRSYCNTLESRISYLECCLKHKSLSVGNVSTFSITGVPMANTTSNASMRVNKMGRPKGSKNK